MAKKYKIFLTENVWITDSFGIPFDTNTDYDRITINKISVVDPAGTLKPINIDEPAIDITDAIRVCVTPNEVDEYMLVNGGPGQGGIKNSDLNSGFPKWRNSSDNCETT